MYIKCNHTTLMPYIDCIDDQSMYIDVYHVQMFACEKIQSLKFNFSFDTYSKENINMDS